MHSAKKLLTFSKSQFLLLSGCIKCRFTILLQSPLQALAMPRRTEGMRCSVPQAINPSLTLLTPAASWTSLGGVSSSRKVLVHSWKENIWPQTQHSSHTTNSRLGKNLLKRSTCYSPSPVSASLSYKLTEKTRREKKNVLHSLEINNSEN